MWFGSKTSLFLVDFGLYIGLYPLWEMVVKFTISMISSSIHGEIRVFPQQLPGVPCGILDGKEVNASYKPYRMRFSTGTANLILYSLIYIYMNYYRYRHFSKETNSINCLIFQ